MQSEQENNNKNDENKMTFAKQKELFCDKTYQIFVSFCKENYSVKEKDLHIFGCSFKRGIIVFKLKKYQKTK